MAARQQPQAKPVPIEMKHDWSAEQWDWPMQGQDGIVNVENTKDNFEVGLEMRHFTPKEIDVKVINRDLVIHCVHDERQDKHGSISREVNRIYKLPNDVDVSTVKTVLKPDGILKISASKARRG